jgi:hypothetical protein
MQIRPLMEHELSLIHPVAVHIVLVTPYPRSGVTTSFQIQRAPSALYGWGQV